MAQKAAKATAKKNQEVLANLHLISFGINVFFLVWRFFVKYSTSSRRAVLLYALFNCPALGIEFYLENIGRSRDARKSGDDLNSGGMMELMWDVVYVTWACLVLVAFFGESLWWLWVVIPVYGAYAAYTTATGMRQMLGGGLGGAANDMAAGPTSKRQTKLEKRQADGKHVKYR